MKVIENPKITSILPFLHFDLDRLEHSLITNQSICIIDNMMLTRMRKDIVQIPALLKGFTSTNLIVIPDVILEEAARNLSERAFNNYYNDLFQLLSKENEIYVVGLDLLLELLQGMVGKKDAFSLLKNISFEATRINQTISGLINRIDVNSATALAELDEAITYNGKNAGERVITIFSLVFLSMYYGPIYIFSEDVKGIYGPFRTFINNEKLMDIIDVSDSVDLIEQYQFLSYESFIHSVFIEENMSGDELQDLIRKSGRNQPRHILYSLDGYSCYTQISNKNLAEWISEDRKEIQF